MNKNWKIVLMVVVMLFTAIFTITDVNATNTIKLTSKSYIKAGGRNHAWFKTNAGYAYCITPKKTGPSVGTKMHLDKEITGTSGNVLYYMLKNDNPSNKNNYVYTQAAIWRYYNNYVPYKSGSTVISKSKTIVSKAKASKATPKRVGITVVNKSGSMSISSDNKYYQSGKFTIKTTSGTKYTASVSGKAYIVNVSGNKQTTFNSGDSFYVRVNDADVTKSLTFTITIKTSGTNEYVRVYSTGKSSYQKLVLLDSESKSASKQLSVAVTPVKRVCTYVNGKYYGKNGTVVSEATYKDECMPKCEEKDGKYYDDKGNTVDKVTYIKICKKPVCSKVDDIFFGKDGEVVTEDVFRDQCMPKCEEKDGKYFDDKGNEIDKINYYKICIKPTCEKIDDTYFGKDGSIVTEEEFSNQCIPKCIEKDGKYYDDKGNETDKTTYIKVCKKPICEKVDDTYFGKNGDVVSESEYKKQCVHVCEVYNNQYYGKDGLVVSKETYKDECEHVVVPVPNTGTSLLESLLYIVLGTGIVLGGLGFVGYQNKLSVK
ncbi:MAG: Cys-Gln thioester bond-forming surface protein [Bacilli bacterium]|nr:Cys-Gln thioester bond-forming surface protein [Bacilli bacterium]